MRLFNETDYQVGQRVAMYEPGKPFVAVVVKGTFRLVEGGPCTALPADRQAKIARPQNFLDEHGNSLKAPGDLAPFKPRADCLFVGSAHAPAGRPVRHLEATFAIGGMRKTLNVYGDRRWVRDADGATLLTTPEPFAELPIRAEYAHGGIGSKYNFHGIGLEPLGDAAGAQVPVANILPAGVEAERWHVDGPHAGFGPLLHSRLPRRALLGTLDGKWLARRRPLPPVDFDPAFFNTAPEDQQVDGYLAGDEAIQLLNLHPQAADFRSALPGIRVRVFVNRHLDPGNPRAHEFAEVHVVLDTCVVDVPDGTLTLVWRGTLEIGAHRDSHIDHLLVVEEPLAGSRPVSHYASLLAARLVDRRAEAAGVAQAERDRKVREINATALETAVRMLKEGGAPPDLIAEVEKQETIADAQKLIMARLEQAAANLPKPQGAASLPPDGS